MNEEQLHASTVELARAEGWIVHYSARSLRCTPGFPSLCLAHPKRGVLFRELKADDGSPSSEQIRWLGVLRGAGADADVWRPRDWPVIVSTLKGTPR